MNDVISAPARYAIRAYYDEWENGTVAVRFARLRGQEGAPKGNFGSAIADWKKLLGIPDFLGIKDTEDGNWVFRPGIAQGNIREAADSAFGGWSIDLHWNQRRHRGAMDWPLWRLS